VGAVSRGAHRASSTSCFDLRVVVVVGVERIFDDDYDNDFFGNRLIQDVRSMGLKGPDAKAVILRRSDP
jgi:hypothetical protein